MGTTRCPDGHVPAIMRGVPTATDEQHTIICSKCGTILWFVPLEEEGIITEGWNAQRWEE